jgi:hypothetical protein
MITQPHQLSRIGTQMNQSKSRILLRGEKVPGSKPPHGGSWLYDPETDTMTLLEPPTIHSSSKPQTTAKQRAPSDPENSHMVREPFLSDRIYRDMLSLWVKFSCLLSVDLGWREGFRSRLTGHTEKWEEIMRTEARHINESERGNLIGLLKEAKGDPLRFLNLAGISLANILAEMEYIKVQRTTRDALREMRQSKVKRDEAAKAIRKAALYLDKVRPFVEGYVQRADHLVLVPERLKARPRTEVPNLDQYPRGDWLRSIAWIISNSEKLQLIPADMNKKGGPPKDMLGYAARELQRICESEMEESLQQERDKKHRFNILLGRKLLMGAVTAILMAGFPEWFKRDTNPVRNVRNALKKR